MKHSSPKRLAAASRQRYAVRERSEGGCEFERVQWDPMQGSERFERCGRPAGQTAHIYRRWKTGPACFEPDMALDACADCHTRFDAYSDEIRVPEAMRRAAAKLIETLCKSTDGVPPGDLA